MPSTPLLWGRKSGHYVASDETSLCWCGRVHYYGCDCGQPRPDGMPFCRSCFAYWAERYATHNWCPTPCDPDCDADCHEGHHPRHKQRHDPDECPSKES